MKEKKQDLPDDMAEKMAGKIAEGIAGYIPEGYEEKSLIWEWSPKASTQEGCNIQWGRPTFIEIEGEKKEIQYMQNGIIIFKDGGAIHKNATYERIIDNDEVQAVKVFYKSKKEESKKEKE